MLTETHPLIRQFFRFLALPYCYFKYVNWDECQASRLQVIKDFLYIFFKLKYFPDNYSPCRLWEKDRKEWFFYYGSSYHPYQRAALRKEVQRIEYVFLFDNKELSELVCRGMAVPLPEYYGVISPEIDYRNKIREAVFSNELKKVIIKPVMGQGGKGIFLAYNNGESIRVKCGKKDVDLSEWHLTERSIMQEVVIQNEKIANISPSSVNTIRVVSLYTKSGDVIIIGAYMRFGIDDSFIDNVSAGGIEVGVDLKVGKLKKISCDKEGKQYTEHPTTRICFEGIQIPYWKRVIQLSKNIQKACSFFKLLGMDIAVLHDGPVLIELNPNPDIIMLEQVEGPLLKNKKTYREFAQYNLLINKFQKNLYR
jgi:hypothetical protein